MFIVFKPKLTCINGNFCVVFSFEHRMDAANAARISKHSMMWLSNYCYRFAFCGRIGCEWFRSCGHLFLFNAFDMISFNVICCLYALRRGFLLLLSVYDFIPNISCNMKLKFVSTFIVLLHNRGVSMLLNSVLNSRNSMLSLCYSMLTPWIAICFRFASDVVIHMYIGN